MKLNLSILKRREVGNSIWNTADILLLPTLMVLATPFFIKKLGPEQYGIWMIVNSFIVALGIANIGVGDAVIKFVSKYHALNDPPNIKRITSSAFSINLLVMAVIIAAGVILFFVIRSYNFLNIQEKNMLLASSSILLGSIVFGMKQMEQLVLSIYKGFERYDTSSIISIISKFLMLSGQVVVVILGYGLFQIFLAGTIISVVVVFFEYVYAKYRVKYLSFYPHYEKRTIKEIFSFSTWSWTQSVLSIIASQADRFVVISLAGARFLAYYALASTIGGQIHQVFTAAISWVFPKVSGKTERKEELSPLYYKLQFLVITAGALIITVLIVFQRPIFHTWLGDETYNHSIILIKLFLYLAFINMVSIVPYFFLLGANLIRLSALFMFISVVFTILLMIIFYQIDPVNGLAYGKVISSLLSIPIMLMFVHYIIIDKKDRVSVFILYGAVLLLIAAFYLENFYSFIPAAISIIMIKKFYDFKLKALLAAS
jgi:O-antigen/teichoic acid export membrane protein